ncbi:MAG: nucleoside 2-deoxyribosyltransferase [Candidatus Cloacimonetes bacterium]|nr:nucleoside 2-deoxyribosyltransferase [Candidatus Cloacimonadota bacterium]
MKIVICGSMAFAKQMKEVKECLENRGHRVYLPQLVDRFIEDENWRRRVTRGNSQDRQSGASFKKEHDLIRAHYRKIKQSDAILVLNYKKKKIPGYIGGNTFLEMGFAYVLGKKIYLLYSIPKIDFCYEEIIAMEPHVLDGDLEKIK